jgi:RNA polymerase sigma factor (sigma-70 family)
MGVNSLGRIQSNGAYSDMDVAAHGDGGFAAKDGNALIRAYEDKIRYVALQFAGRVPLDELMQEGRTALWHARKLWRHDSSLWTYAKRAVFAAMLRATTKEVSESRGHVHEISVDEATTGIVLARECLALLDVEKRAVVRLYLDGETFESIAALLGKSKSSVDRTFRAAIALLREQL